MAVVQISRIQCRRGQKNLFGIPQLSSGELAWAVDTQELFIGNGSVADGAPYVGNTRILTEHDNILELAAGYRFANDDISITASVSRSLQDKLDELQVSVRDFGPDPDPSSDYSVFFSTAFTQLFQNTDETYRKVLIIPNGYYYFGAVLRIPSNVELRGETRDGVVLDVNNNGIEFLNENNESIFTSSSVPINIKISNLTITHALGTTNLNALKDSSFNDVTWISNYTLGQDVLTPVFFARVYDFTGVTSGGDATISGSQLASPINIIFTTTIDQLVTELVTALNLDGLFDNNFIASKVGESLVITQKPDSLLSLEASDDILDEITVTIVNDPLSLPRPAPSVGVEESTGIRDVNASITWTNANFGTRANNIRFHDCYFLETTLAIKCIFTDAVDTEIFFEDCVFQTGNTGVYLEGVDATQKNLWKFHRCKFKEIARQAFISTLGTDTLIDACQFELVGNDTNSAAFPVVPFVQFGNSTGNVVINSISDRHQQAGITLSANKVGVPEVYNASRVDFSNTNTATIFPTNTFLPLAVFSSHVKFINIDYILTLGEYRHTRRGRLVIALDDDMKNQAALLDDFTYSPSTLTTTGASTMTNFEFNIDVRDNGDVEYQDPEDSTVGAAPSFDTLLLSYKNPLSTGTIGTISYTVSYGV
jgi:hypothetical protein